MSMSHDWRFECIKFNDEHPDKTLASLEHDGWEVFSVTYTKNGSREVVLRKAVWRP